MDALPNAGVFYSIRKNAKFSMPIFALACFVLAYKVSWLFSLAGMVFLWIAWRNRNNNTNDVQSKAITDLSAEYQHLMNKISQLYGSNAEVSKQILDFKKEWKRINDKLIKAKRAEWFGYTFIGVLLIIAFMWPKEKAQSEINAETKLNETELMNEIKLKIDQHDLNWVQNRMGEIKSAENTLLIKTLMQSSVISDKFKEIEAFFSAQDFSSASKELSKLHWQKNALDYDLELIEEPYFKNFVVQKNGIIERLPDEWKLTKEDEFSY
jgi:hypothetical protein